MKYIKWYRAGRNINYSWVDSNVIVISHSIFKSRKRVNIKRLLLSRPIVVRCYDLYHYDNDVSTYNGEISLTEKQLDEWYNMVLTRPVSVFEEYDGLFERMLKIRNENSKMVEA